MRRRINQTHTCKHVLVAHTRASVRTHTRTHTQDMLGLEKHGEFRSDKENVDEDILILGRGHGRVEIDLMAPIDVTKSPKVCQNNEHTHTHTAHTLIHSLTFAPTHSLSVCCSLKLALMGAYVQSDWKQITHPLTSSPFLLNFKLLVRGLHHVHIYT